ncbi:MAG TPA: hypothetical protein PLX93_02660, partial [Bacilli bacterium]|nr:hypothetical protein [Bacilli bacterium]
PTGTSPVDSLGLVSIEVSVAVSAELCSLEIDVSEEEGSTSEGEPLESPKEEQDERISVDKIKNDSEWRIALNLSLLSGNR